MTMHEDCCQDLLTAVYSQAVKDYMDAREKLLCCPNRNYAGKWMSTIKECAAFLGPDLCDMADEVIFSKYENYGGAKSWEKV